jgi:peptidoglycan hydrolase-like protein with peptidoglycan-binding domain
LLFGCFIFIDKVKGGKRMYPIIQNFISRNRSHQALSAIGMVVHATDDFGATDENEQRYFNSGDRQASANAFIDWDSITETVPDNEVAWHAGPTANHRFIGVELCEPATHDAAKFNEVWNRAVWYFATKFINRIRCKTITKSNLMSHAEVSNTWHETDHQDPISYFSAYGKTVDQFRAEVQAEINKQLNISTAPVQQTNSAPVQNSTGVLKLQQIFNYFGFRDCRGGNLMEDGASGVNTMFAIKEFQNCMGLEIDGIAGNNTWAAINQINSRPLDGITYPHYEYATRYIQRRTGARVDGSFGGETAAHVKMWQLRNNLQGDGIVGAASWKKLLY